MVGFLESCFSAQSPQSVPVRPFVAFSSLFLLQSYRAFLYWRTCIRIGPLRFLLSGLRFAESGAFYVSPPFTATFAFPLFSLDSPLGGEDLFFFSAFLSPLSNQVVGRLPLPWSLMFFPASRDLSLRPSSLCRPQAEFVKPGFSFQGNWRVSCFLF